MSSGRSNANEGVLGELAPRGSVEQPIIERATSTSKIRTSFSAANQARTIPVPVIAGEKVLRGARVGIVLRGKAAGAKLWITPSLKAAAERSTQLEVRAIYRW